MPDQSQQVNPDVNERSRLLPDSPSSARSVDVSIRNRNALALSLRLSAILFMNFLPSFAYFHLVPPRLQLLEQSLCRRFYEIRDPTVIQQIGTWPYYRIEESLCKQNFIQSNLSNVRSWASLFDGLCVFVVSVPYGLVADKFGRVLVYILGLIGLLLYNVWYVLVIDAPSVNTVLFATGFLVLGGGVAVTATMVITMGIDMTPQEFHSTVLYWLLSASSLGYIVGSALTPLTMRVSWLPYVVSLVAVCVAALVASLVWYSTVTSAKHNTSAEASDAQSQDSDEDRPSCSICSPVKVLRYARQHPLLTCVLALFPLQATRSAFPELIMPYAAKRYGWHLRQTGILDTVNGVVTLALSLAVLPIFVQILNRYVSVPTKADCIVSMCSAAAFVLGSIVIAVAPSTAVLLVGWVAWSLGFGIRMSILSIATSLVMSQQTARLTTTILSIETISDIVISPLIWRTWSAGLNLGDETALGLPWFVLAIIMTIVIAVLAVVYRFLDKKPKDTVPEIIVSAE